VKLQHSDFTANFLPTLTFPRKGGTFWSFARTSTGTYVGTDQESGREHGKETGNEKRELCCRGSHSLIGSINRGAFEFNGGYGKYPATGAGQTGKSHVCRGLFLVHGAPF
jgi:hypothetical protein